MIGFTSVVLTLDKNYLIAGDFSGFIHIFPIKQLLKGHIATDSHEEPVYQQQCSLEVTRYGIIAMQILSSGELVLADRENVKILSSSFLSNTIVASSNSTKPRSLLNANITSDEMKKYKINEDLQIKIFFVKHENIYVGTDSGLIVIFDKSTEKQKNEISTVPYLSEAIKESTSKNLNPMMNLKQNPITSMVQAKGDHLIVGSQIGVIQIWKISGDDNLEYKRTLKHNNNCFFESIYAMTVFYSVLFCAHSGFITAWDFETGNIKYVINTSQDIYFIKVIDEQRIVAGGENKSINYYDISTGQRQKSIQTTNNANLSIYFEFTSKNSEIDQSNLFITAGSSQFLDVFYNNQRIFLLTNPNLQQIQQQKLQQQNAE